MPNKNIEFKYKKIYVLATISKMDSVISNDIPSLKEIHDILASFLCLDVSQ